MSLTMNWENFGELELRPIYTKRKRNHRLEALVREALRKAYDKKVRSRLLGIRAFIWAKGRCNPPQLRFVKSVLAEQRAQVQIRPPFKPAYILRKTGARNES